jgi:DNA invertase Pin-like site-specific DNA recombinase
MVFPSEEAATLKTYDALIRVSKTNGRKESDDSTMTITDQEAAITRAIQEKGGRRGKTFKALDQSGFTIHESDVYPALLDRVRTGKSDGFVVAYGDRLSRNWRTVGKFFDDLEAVAAEYVDASSPEIDYRTDEGRMITGMKAVMGEVPSLAARKRGNRIADLTVARGVPNRVPYGYRRNADKLGVKTDPDRDAKALVPDEPAASVVQRIFRMRVDGYRVSAIIETLDEDGVPGPSGGLWTNSSIMTIIRNEAYIGVVKLGGRRLEGAHTPLVSKADWERAKGTRVVTHSGIYKTGLAGGLLECSGCGRPLSVSGDPARMTYACRRRTADGRCPRPVYVSKRGADRIVEKLIIDVIEQVDVGQVATAKELTQARVAAEKATAEREAFVKVASALDPDDYLAGYQERRARESEMLTAYDELLSRAADVEALPAELTGWEALPEERKRRVARSLIDRIEVSPPFTRSRLADVSERFTVRWAGTGQLAGAGR